MDLYRCFRLAFLFAVALVVPGLFVYGIVRQVEDAVRWWRRRPKKVVQTDLDPGNCWQACVASLLKLPLDALPPQVVDGKWVDDYQLVLQRYLTKHHQKMLSAYTKTWDFGLWESSSFYILFLRAVDRRIEGNHAVIAHGHDRVWWDPAPKTSSNKFEVATEPYARLLLVDVTPAVESIPEVSEFLAGLEAVPCACPRCAWEREVARIVRGSGDSPTPPGPDRVD